MQNNNIRILGINFLLNRTAEAIIKNKLIPLMTDLDCFSGAPIRSKAPNFTTYPIFFSLFNFYEALISIILSLITERINEIDYINNGTYFLIYLLYSEKHILIDTDSFKTNKETPLGQHHIPLDIRYLYHIPYRRPRKGIRLSFHCNLHRCPYDYIKEKFLK